MATLTEPQGSSLELLDTIFQTVSVFSKNKSTTPRTLTLFSSSSPIYMTPMIPILAPSRSMIVHAGRYLSPVDFMWTFPDMIYAFACSIK
ncbi:MAG: hypothetical protein GX469_07545 [Treponema sp.]|nr:hypothetical protein [Spirochaetota bacterium]NLH90158.1 hypothetical protein [Treponema sp.]HOH17632.1 hypothetical protein [Rectinema sp.]